MLIFGIILLIIIFLLLLILFLEFSVILSISKNNLEIFIKILGIRFKIPLDRKNKGTEEKAPTDENSVMKKFMNTRNEFTRKKQALKAVLSYLRYKIKLFEIGILGEFGTGNAATTGIAYGSVQAFLGTLSSFIGQYFEIEKPILVNVDLNFEKAVFDINLNAVVKSKLFYLLKAVLIFFRT